ncbi:MAG: 4'-phosphopantetheinyl transferase superfamily protein [Neisseriaceae bacterium]
MSTRVWVFDLRKVRTTFKAFVPLLSVEELKRYKGYLREEDALLYLNSHLLLKCLLNRYTGFSLEEIDARIRTNSYGKPYLPGGCFFSLSHTRDLVAVALSAQEVGVDVEGVTHVRFSFEDFVTIWSPAEIKYLRRLPLTVRDTAFLLSAWTRKEAVVKALGRGLSQPLNSVVIPLSSRAKELAHKAFIWEDEEQKSLTLEPLGLPYPFFGCVAGKNLNLKELKILVEGAEYLPYYEYLVANLREKNLSCINGVVLTSI